MSRPPIKAFEAVKRYCQKNKKCEGCPLYIYGFCACFVSPASWVIEREGKKE